MYINLSPRTEGVKKLVAAFTLMIFASLSLH